MKKMTQKEFKKVFESAGFDFEVWGWEGILNMISAFETCQEKEMITLGYQNLADENRRRADAIYEALDQRGYYESRI